MRSGRIALARMTLGRRQRISPIVRQALFAPLSRRVIHTPHASTRGRVAVPYRVLINILAARASLAARRERTPRIKVPIVAQLAQVTLRAHRTIQAHDLKRTQLVVVDLSARSIVRTRTLLAHVRQLMLAHVPVPPVQVVIAR